ARIREQASLLDNAKDAIIVRGIDQRVRFWNKGAERLYGYSTEEAIGQNIAMLVPPSGLDDITGFLEDLKRGFPIERFETVRRRKDKVLIHVSLTISPVYDREGRVVGASSMAQDITQRKLAEERLSQSRAQLKGIIDSAMDAVITVDENQRVVMFNTAAEAIFEYSADEIVGKHLERLIPQRLRTAHAGHIGEFSKTGTTSRAMGSLGALSGLRRDGTEFPIEASISQVKINGRKFFTAIVRDVTERQRTDKALREQTSVLELAQVLVRDMDDRIVLWNRGAEKLYGFTAEEAMGRLSHDLLRTEFPEPIEAIKKTLLREGEWEGELVHHKRDGSRIVVASVWVLERQNSGQPQRVLEANTDITERKRAEEATKLAQARLVSAMEGGGMGTWVWDIANGRIEWDESIHALLGRSQEELAGGSLEPFFSWIHPQDRDRTRAAIEDALREGVNYQLEYRVFRPDQSIIWITSRGRVERNERGEPFRITGVAIDITDRKKMEEQILQSQKMQSLGTLAGGIAHDFNNILLAIGGNASLAVEDLEPDHPAMTSLREISKASARAKNLVRQILTFSRRQAPARKPLAVRTVIEEALALLRATLPARIEITAKFDPDLPSISADSTQLHQVIMNLGTNAARAIGEGEGVLQVTAKALNVTPDFVGSNARLKEGRYVRLSISDNGCGMDSAILDRIFDPFFTTQDPGQGTGLGLSVVHGIMNDHDGSISVYSERGKGSTFRLYFPAVKEAGEKPILPAKMPLGHGQRLLYVDDEEALVRLSQRSLGRLGYHVTGETNPSRAVQIFREKPLQFDAIITDLSMPGMSGSEVARQVLAIRPEIPVVMMSGFVRPEDEKEARRIGVRYVILKPDTIEELAQSLDQIFTVGSTSARTIGRLSRS
ncbi:MAG TPA: PAS domain S-box protein, partial [Candidatus Angelobacter sp.]|nr:PAS domain S-box protein [Candidatus Angelobacter sp.]